jgi:uncharacterized metal-binding protein
MPATLLVRILNLLKKIKESERERIINPKVRAQQLNPIKT